jgi:hypothetical protein
VALFWRNKPVFPRAVRLAGISADPGVFRCVGKSERTVCLDLSAPGPPRFDERHRLLFLAFACSHTHGRLFFSVRDGPWDACGLSEIAQRHRDRWNHNGDFAHSFCRQSLDDSLGSNWGVHRPDLQRGEASATICCRREDG